MYTVTSSSITNAGERKYNEDSTGEIVSEKMYAYLLCDGLGGHGNGDVASGFVVEEMKHNLKKESQMDEMFLKQCVMDAQTALLQKQRAEHLEDSMKTTLCCLVIENSASYIIHVGDSRIYYFHKGKFRFRTPDHSVPQMLYERGDIREKDIRHHEDRSRLLRVMGTEWSSPKYQFDGELPLDKETSFLLCSDGFWELIEEKQMSKALKKSKTPEQWLKTMEEIIWKNGRGTNMDNFSAIAVFVR